MAVDEGTQVTATVLAEDQVKHMSRNVRFFVPEQEGAEPGKIGELLQHLDDVFATASSSAITASHKVAAWNTLCAFLDRISDADLESVRELLWQQVIWKRAFDLYISQAHFVRPKCSRQLLASLTAVLRKAQGRYATIDGLEKDGVRSLVEGIVLGEDQGCVKTCAQALSNFLGKDIVQLKALLHSMPHRPGISCPPKLDDLLLVLFEWMGKADFGSTIGQLVSAILDRVNGAIHESMESGHEMAVTPIWSSALRLAAHTGTVDVPSLRVHLLPVLFKRSVSEFISFLHDLDIQCLDSHRSESVPTMRRAADTELLFASLQTGKDIGFLQEYDGTELSREGDTINVPLRWIGRLLQQASSSARSTALSLLINSQSMTKPFSLATLRLIKRSLDHLFADIDADFRSDVFGYVQRLLDRIRAITAVLARQSMRPHDGPGPGPLEVLKYHKGFLAWLSHFTDWELRPTASYQRHISALKCLSILVKSGLDPRIQPEHLSKSARRETCWPFNLQVLTKESCQSLLDLLVDPFDDVRQTAASVLAMCPASIDEDQSELRLALTRAESAMLMTGRADQADGVAHAYSLLHTSLQHRDDTDIVPRDLYDKLEQSLITARSDLPTAVQRYPLHGLLTSIRHVLTKSDKRQHAKSMDRLTLLLQNVWDVVKPILCNDAPEGYLPESFEEVTEVSAKDTLSYCWRALKEASLLMGVLVSAGTSEANDRGNVLCELSFTQLTELRHRGAFSTVAQTWITCCLQPWSRAKLRGWYDQTLLILRNKTTINTRRSAGLPSLLCGILVADQSAQLMQRAFADLETISRESVDPAFAQEGSLPQVHAMNCCKDILKNSRLGEQSEKHVPSALQLAADALRSDAWAVRNCGLMLFRAVIDRLLGTSDAHLEDDTHFQRKIWAEQHPQLLGIVLGLLSRQTTSSTLSQQARQEGVFPALQLLQRLTIPDDRVVEVRHSVSALMASTSWHIRDRAARTYASFISQGEIMSEMRRLLHTDTCSQNALHGALLAAKHVLLTLLPKHAQANCADEMVMEFSSVTTLVTAASDLYAKNPCPITQAAYLDIYILAAQLRDVFSANVSLPNQSEESRGTNNIRAPDELSALVRVEQTPRPAGEATLRSSLAGLFVAQLFSSGKGEDLKAKSIISLVARLAEVDADAAASLFHSAQDLMKRHATWIYDTKALGVFVEAAAVVLRGPGVEMRAVCAAQELLIAICAISRQRNLPFDGLSSVSRSIVPRQNVTRLNDNQRSADLMLELCSALLETQEQLEIVEDRPFEVWAEACCNAVADVGLFTREAAAHALSKTTIWQDIMKQAQERTSLRLCFAVYDLLNDDDEEIRLLASHTLTNILRANGGTMDENLVPLVASSRILTFMLRRWHDRPEMVEEAFIRAFDLNETSAIDMKAKMSARYKTNTALFAEEKQNLYIDQAREVKVWSKALLHILPLRIASTLRRRLAVWVEESIQALLDKANASPDGPLGWSTDSEVFVLGLRVLYGAEVLFEWVRKGVRVQIRPSVLRRTIFELSRIDQINVHWRREIERIVGESVLGNMRSLHSRLCIRCDPRSQLSCKS